MLSDLVTQRWGVGSTRLHLDMEALALGVLLFDRIVLPTPSDVAEADRWDQMGWDTQAQARRIVQLGELVHFAPWDEQLRADWRAQWEHAKKIGTATRELAYAATPQVIATSAWGDVMASAGEDHLPKVRPVPVIWTTAIGSIVRHIARDQAEPARESTDRSQVKTTEASPYEQFSALRFRRMLEQPVHDAPEHTLDAALRLANSVKFQDARRALYTAEALAASGRMPPEEFGAEIDAAVTRYNQVVAAYGGATRRRVIHHVVPFAAGKAISLSHVPGGGPAGSWLVQRVLARLLPLPSPPQPALDEGAAIGMVQHAMSVVCAAGSRTQIR